MIMLTPLPEGVAPQLILLPVMRLDRDWPLGVRQVIFGLHGTGMVLELPPAPPPTIPAAPDAASRYEFDCEYGLDSSYTPSAVDRRAAGSALEEWEPYAVPAETAAQYPSFAMGETWENFL